MADITDPDLLKELTGRRVVVDTDTNRVYIGTLNRLTSEILELADADAHDNMILNQPLEHHIHETARIGVTPNRKTVMVLRKRVVSVSPLDDVIRFT